MKLFSKNISYLLLIFLLMSCGDREGSFEVKVVSPDESPIESAWIEGGFDWTWYRVFTDSNGVALVPGHARSEQATIMKDNFIPLFVERLDTRQYILEPTPQLLRLIGTAEGTAIIFEADNLVTLSYHGDYHVYT